MCLHYSCQVSIQFCGLLDNDHHQEGKKKSLDTQMDKISAVRILSVVSLSEYK